MTRTYKRKISPSRKEVTRYGDFFIVLGRGAKNQKTFVTGIARLKIGGNVASLIKEMAVIKKCTKIFLAVEITLTFKPKSSTLDITSSSLFADEIVRRIIKLPPGNPK